MDRPLLSLVGEAGGTLPLIPSAVSPAKTEEATMQATILNGSAEYARHPEGQEEVTPRAIDWQAVIVYSLEAIAVVALIVALLNR
jgi:hypothetical protein